MYRPRHYVPPKSYRRAPSTSHRAYAEPPRRSWKPVPPDIYHGKTKEDPYDWFLKLDWFFEVAMDIATPEARFLFAESLLRGDPLKWWRPLKSSPRDPGFS